ncbi:MAG TPA: hypothetical protein GXX14_14260 [Clostridiaceae bacterium]|nr:hypothetical protein [Clostridiaceae bacterium]
MERKLLAGTWKTNITPPLGIALPGGFTERRAQEIQDELYSNAIVIDDGNREIALVSVDVCVIHNNICKDIYRLIEAGCNIKEENILLAATHTHNGPKLGDIFVGVEDTWEEYVENFKKCVASSVIMARKRKKPVKIGAAFGINDRYVFNRRLKKPDGSVVMNFAEKEYLQDCIDSGITDNEVSFFVFEDSFHKPFAFIVNYANHNNAMGDVPNISPDWAGQISKILSRIYGNEVVTLFLPGACGNINWINYKDLSQNFGPELVEKIGTSIAGTILERICDVEYPEVGRIDIMHNKLLIPDRPFCEYDTKEDNTFGKNEGSRIIFAQYAKEKEIASGKELPVNEVDICVVSFGKDMAIAANPAELFVEYGLQIKKNSPFKYTMISELTNGYVGYVCTKHAFEEGGYEVRKTNNSSHLEIDAGEKIVKASVELLKTLHNNCQNAF